MPSPPPCTGRPGSAPGREKASSTFCVMRATLLSQPLRGQARRPRDGAGREHRAVVARREVHHVGAHQRVLGAHQAVVVEEDVLVDAGVVVREPVGRRQQPRVRRRAELEVVALRLQARRAAEREAEVADRLLVADALHDPGDRLVERVGHAPVGPAVVEALGGEADARELLRRAAAQAPQPAALRRGRVVQLARPRLPRAHAGLALAHLHQPGLALAVRDDPVEAVAAHVHEPAALADVALQRVERPLRPVLRVRARDDHRVGVEQRAALAVQVVVGDDVVVVALGLEEADDRQVARELPRRRDRRRAPLRAAG